MQVVIIVTKIIIIVCGLLLLMQTKGLSWRVPTGRRDGRTSLASDAANLPGFTDSIELQKQKFLDKGLNTQDLVTLVGKHPNKHIFQTIRLIYRFDARSKLSFE